MISSLVGKNALVTGGGTGIGRGITELLLQKGCRVAIASRTFEKSEVAAKELNSKHKVSASGMLF